MRNQYAGKCFMCGREVKAGTGFFQSRGSLPKRKNVDTFDELIKNKGIVSGSIKWVVRCKSCVGKGNKA